MIAYKDDNGNEWQFVQFTTEPIKDLRQSAGILFAITESSTVWVSFDSGENWQLRAEILRDMQSDYRAKLEEIVADYERRREELSKQHREEIQRLNIPNANQPI